MKAGLSRSIDTLMHRVSVFMVKYLDCLGWNTKS